MEEQEFSCHVTEFKVIASTPIKEISKSNLEVVWILNHR